MIDYKELRAGNLVNDFSGKSVKLTAMMISFIEFEALKDTSKILETPIPLTSEWLEKFGFKRSDSINKSGSFFFKYVGASELHINPENGVVWIEKDKNMFNNPALIEDVHQLQNLYFALTGEELTIKVPAV